jgi:hypothetical protein
MGGTAVKKWHKRKNTAAEGYEIRGECVWVVYVVDIFYIGEANTVRCSPQWIVMSGRAERKSIKRIRK